VRPDHEYWASASYSVYVYYPKVMARLSWPGWLTRYRDDLPAGRQSPIPVLTMPDVKQIC